MPLYKSEVACRICRLTPRTLDYWVTTGLVAPRRRFLCARRTYYLFDRDGLITLRVVKALREAGVSLQRIRVAIKALTTADGRVRRVSWLVTDGVDVYVRSDHPHRLISLARRERGQFAFSLVAVRDVRRTVVRALADEQPFDRQRYAGRVADA